MICMKKILTLTVFVFAIFVAFAQTDTEKGLEAITESAVKGQMEFLASDWTEGRAVGTKGAYLAADLLRQFLKYMASRHLEI